jgi:hypothetical protein
MEKNNLIPVSQDINNGMKELYDYWLFIFQI